MSCVQLSSSGRNLCEKYRICYPFDPSVDYESDPQFDAYVRWAFPPVMLLDPPKHWFEVSAGANLSSTQISQVNGRLVITIDPTYSLDQIIQHVKDFLTEAIEPTMHRLGPSETLIDHWMVYRKKEFEGKSLVDIARGLAGKSKQAHPPYDAELKRVDKNVRDAYKRAKVTAVQDNLKRDQ